MKRARARALELDEYLLGAQGAALGVVHVPVIAQHEAGEVDPVLLGVLGQPSARLDLQLAAGERAQRVLALLVRAVDLRAVPPVGL